jgi:hypothetical protein
VVCVLWFIVYVHVTLTVGLQRWRFVLCAFWCVYVQNKLLEYIGLCFVLPSVCVCTSKQNYGKGYSFCVVVSCVYL